MNENGTGSHYGPRKIVVTGASSGIGRKVCEMLAARGDEVHAIARRSDRLNDLQRDTGAEAHVVDVSDKAHLDEAAADIGDGVHALIHCAGGARGSSPVLEANWTHWEWMWKTNVQGSINVLRTFGPELVEQGHGHIAVVTSVAGFEALNGSSGYSTSKFAQSAMVQTLRNELIDANVHVTEVAPGLVQTEFFEQRFPGDSERANEIFSGLDPLQADDVARSLIFAIDQPEHVNIDRIVLRPIRQGANGRFARR